MSNHLKLIVDEHVDSYVRQLESDIRRLEHALDAALAENAKLAQDAARNRWLRKFNNDLHITIGPAWDMGHLYAEKADTAIDRAMGLTAEDKGG